LLEFDKKKILSFTDTGEGLTMSDGEALVLMKKVRKRVSEGREL